MASVMGSMTLRCLTKKPPKARPVDSVRGLGPAAAAPLPPAACELRVEACRSEEVLPVGSLRCGLAAGVAPGFFAAARTGLEGACLAVARERSTGFRMAVAERTLLRLDGAGCAAEDFELAWTFLTVDCAFCCTGFFGLMPALFAERLWTFFWGVPEWGPSGLFMLVSFANACFLLP